ncbi:hypothetical protein [Thermococcus henrietii]|uniref:hypothetical protein n=1 Tax=Thermococcus henrietii TaxID=2016361 RepID=UPI001CB78216|nr:hypothetical protein [Thermococcus henrietii]
MAMRKLALVLVSVILVALVSGCVSTGSPGASNVTSGSYTGTTSPAASGPKLYTTEELLEKMKGIEQFTYFENTSLKLTMNLAVGNLTQSENVTIIYRKAGYVDLKDREASINITTITFPGGASVFTRQLVKGNDIYIFASGSWIKLTNATSKLNVSKILNFTWEYNTVSFAMKYLKRKPSNVSYANGTELLYYPITKADLEAIASAFLGPNTNVSLNVTNGILELRFRNGTFVGGRMAYRIEMTLRTVQPTGTPVEVHEVGHVYDEFVVKDINVKKPVHVPASYRA